MKRRFDFKSMKFKIWVYVMLFSVAILVMLWLMQIAFIQVFYRTMKTQSILNAAQQIAELYGRIQGQALKTELDGIANDSDLFVSIMDASGKRLVVTDPVDRDYQTPLENKAQWPGFREPPQNDGDDPPGNSRDTYAAFADKILSSADQEAMETFSYTAGRDMLLYGRVIHTQSNETALLMISSPLQPLTETVRILSRQLGYISVVIFALALGISLLIAQSISRPLVRITGKAKLLAEGKYDMTFDHGRYTEVNQLADTLNYATHALGQVDRLRSELIANVSHDLRTPLTMIKIYAEMIRDLSGENRKKRDQNVAVIIEESDRLTSLVQDLLDISRIQSGTMPFQPAAFDISQTIRKILHRYDALAQKEGYRFDFRQDRPSAVLADEPKIEQVLYNLLNNAVNYTGADKLVSVSLQDHGSHVRVSVADTGMGIAPEDIDRIWDRYYKVDREHRRAVTGTGLGLSIVKSILDLHHARYGVDSIPGKGSTFWFELEKADEPA